MDNRVDSSSPWLLLVHQVPAEPSRVRVKIWRRLQSVGAVAIKNSVYVLPNSSETREDFEWIRAEITAEGGEAMVFSAKAIGDLSSAGIREAIESARQSEWRELHKECEEALNSDEAQVDLRNQIRNLRARAVRIDKIDYFGVSGRQEVLTVLEKLERRIDPQRTISQDGLPRRDPAQYKGRVWFTRPHPGIDRMASAWLIRRFIDPDATFRFGEKIPQQDNAVPFDMFGVELGHQGDRVTFETLMIEFGVNDPALSRIARIVRELDLRMEDATDAETATVDRLITGLRSSFSDDTRLLDHGIAIFEALYASFSPP